MLPDPKVKCPYTAFKKSCCTLAQSCPKFIGVKGTAADGSIIDQYGCADGFLPRLMIENAQLSRQTGAAVESLRNEIVKDLEVRREALVAFARTGGPLLNVTK